MGWLGDSSHRGQAWTAVGLPPRYPRCNAELFTYNCSCGVIATYHSRHYSTDRHCECNSGINAIWWSVRCCVLMDRWYWWRTRSSQFTELLSALLAPTWTMLQSYSVIWDDSEHRSTLEYVYTAVVLQQIWFSLNVLLRLLRSLLFHAATDQFTMYNHWSTLAATCCDLPT